MTKRKAKSAKPAAPKAPLDVVAASAAVRKQSVRSEAHDLCHLDSERASKLRKRPTRY